MVCLFRRYIFLMLSIFIILLSTGCTEEEVEPPKDKNQDWNQEKEDNPSYELDSLYHLTSVPELEKLLVNSNFIQQITVNEIPYLYGYNQDGSYAAFIYYMNNETEGYLVQIFETITGDLSYSAFIPMTEDILTSKEFILTNEVLNTVYEINLVPDRLTWNSGMNYTIENNKWIFEEVSIDRSTYLAVKNKNSNWYFLRNKQINFKANMISLFTVPGHPNKITFLLRKNVFIDNEKKNSISYTPIFVNLYSLTSQNSESGITRKADDWLYGGFIFIYNQRNTGNRNGFVAVSDDSKINYLDNGTYAKDVKQWVYMDQTGEMKWYGNSEGIFDKIGEPLKDYKGSYYYNMKIIFGASRQSLNYLIIDQYDENSDKLIQTIEFKWDQETKELKSTVSF